MVLDVAKHAADLVRYQAAKGRHEREDRDALRALEQVPLELPAGLTLQWLGVAGYRLTYQDHTLLLDPFVSRFPLRDLVRRRTTLPDPGRVAAVDAPGTVVGIACGHAHWDHSLDTPALARRFGCRAFGSRSLANQLRVHGIAGQAVEVEPYHRYELGPFEVSFTPSVHSKLVFGRKVPMDGDTDATSLSELIPQAYRCGQTWGIRVAVAGTVFYHQGSADLIDDAVRDRDVNVFLAGIAGRNFSPGYWSRILPRLRPDVVVPMHYDDFFAPADEPDMTFLPQSHVARVPDELRAVSRDLAVAALPRLAS